MVLATGGWHTRSRHVLVLPPGLGENRPGVPRGTASQTQAPKDAGPPAAKRGESGAKSRFGRTARPKLINGSLMNGDPDTLTSVGIVTAQGYEWPLSGQVFAG